jgi:predicted AAA+ superfamily ATPase
VPFKPNFQKLAERTGISVNTLKAYLIYLEEARIIHQLKQEGKGTNLLIKLEKIYLNNTNTMFTLSKNQPEKGSLRETFFANQVSAIETVYASKKTDFIVNNKYSFEIGGKNKTKKQIIDLENAFVVKDDIEIGFENQIPLWLFGFLY